MYKAIVIGSKGVNAVGLIRSLGQENIHVIYMSTFGRIESKYVKEYYRLSVDKNKWMDFFIEYGQKSKERIAMFPTDDDTAFWIDENYKILNDFFVIPHLNGEMKKFADKSIMNQIAKSVGFNVPDFIRLPLSNAERVNNYPIILKPYAGFAGDKGDILICNNDDEYKNAIQIFITRGYQEILLQQFLNDPLQEEIGIMGMALDNGDILIPGIIHKIRSYPTGKGSTSYAMFSSQKNGIDEDKIRELISCIGYVGIFDIEMIKAYEKYWFIEINFRNGQYGYVPTVAGCNLPANWLYGMKQMKIKNYDKLREVFYVNEREDYKHVKNGEISRKEWLKQFRAATAYGMYCPGDQRPFVRQYIKIPDRVIIKIQKMHLYIKDLFLKEEWNIAIREKNDKFLWEKGGTSEKFTVLSNTIRYWAADPFIITFDDKDYLFFEMFDRLKGKGVIGYREINGGKISRMKIAYKAEYHLSFPFIFHYNNDVYMMPEYSEGKELFLLKATHFPDKWEKVESWMNEKRLVDSILLSYQGNIFLLTQELESGYSSDKLSLYIKQDKKWIPHKQSPVLESLANSRLAGKVFFENNQLIRVAQDCQNGYGTRLHFSNIMKLNKDEYKEEMFQTINVEDLKTDLNHKFCGVHTYNFNKRYEVIDLKNYNRLRIFSIFNLVWKIVYRLKG